MAKTDADSDDVHKAFDAALASQLDSDLLRHVAEARTGKGREIELLQRLIHLLETQVVNRVIEIGCSECDYKAPMDFVANQLSDLNDHVVYEHGYTEKQAWDRLKNMTLEPYRQGVLYSEDILDSLQEDPTVLHAMSCEACGHPFDLTGGMEAAIQASKDHFADAHGVTGEEADRMKLAVTWDADRIRIYHCPRCEVRQREPLNVDTACLSMTDNETYVCTACGTHEALEGRATGQVTPKADWPVDYAQERVGNMVGFQRPDWAAQRSNRSHNPSPVPTPKELPDLRLHLVERWNEDGVFDRFADVSGKWHRDALKNSSLWWVKDEMVDLVTAAAKSIPDDVKGSEVDLPSDQAYGLAVLGKSWVGTDATRPGESCHVDAIAWGPCKVDGIPSIAISFYRYVDFAGGLSKNELEEVVESGLINEARSERIGVTDGGDPTYRLSGGAWHWIGQTNWPLDERINEFNHDSTFFIRPTGTTQLAVEAMTEDRMWFAAFCLLINHRLSDTETTYPARQVRRRSERAGVQAKAVSKVRIVRLRQPKHDTEKGDGEARHVEWSHRWMVGSHWAWRRCGPKGGQRRLVFIAPYVKGPADKELVIKENVRVWVK